MEFGSGRPSSFCPAVVRTTLNKYQKLGRGSDQASFSLSSVFSFVYASNSIIIQQRPIEVETKWLNQARFNLCLNILDNH